MGFRIKALSILFLVVGISSISYAKNESSKDESSKNYVFAIKGGISLGSYEAGLNWILVEQLRRMHEKKNLQVVTGASAGAINAVISAIHFCSSKGDSVESNLYKTAWNVDARDLLGQLGGEEQFREGDPAFNDIVDNLGLHLQQDVYGSVDRGGILQRKALLNSLKAVYKEVEEGGFRHPCKVQLGIAITKLIPAQENKNGIPIKRQRYIVPITAEVKKKDGKLRFYNTNPSVKEFTDIDSFLYLTQAKNGEIPFAEVLKLSLASSAFPFAFAPVPLDVCIENGKGEKHTSSCPDDYHAKTELFIDGGSFDNAPIGIGMDLSDYKNSGNKSEIVFVSPGDQRERVQKNENSGDEKYRPNVKKHVTGIQDFMALGGHMIDYGTSAELYTTLREMKKDSKRLLATRRYYFLVGDYLGHFGAFLDPSFRDFDYYVGVYDGIINLSTYDCMLEHQAAGHASTANKVTNACIVERAKQHLGEFDIADSSGAELIQALGYREFPDEWKTVSEGAPTLEEMAFAGGGTTVSVEPRLQLGKLYESVANMVGIDTSHERGTRLQKLYEAIAKKCGDDSDCSNLLKIYYALDRDCPAKNDEDKKEAGKKADATKASYKKIAALTGADKQGVCGDPLEMANYTSFISELNSGGVLKETEPGKSSLAQRMAAKDDRTPIVVHAIERLREIEKKKLKTLEEDKRTNTKTIEKEKKAQKRIIAALKGASILGRSFAYRVQHGAWPVSTESKSEKGHTLKSMLMPLVPDELGIDGFNGVPYINYIFDPIPIAGSDFSAEIGIDPFHFGRKNRRTTNYSAVYANIKYNFSDPVFTSAGAGAIGYYNWKHQSIAGVKRTDYGLMVKFGFLVDKVHLSLIQRGVTNTGGGIAPKKSRFFLLISISDLKGIAEFYLGD